MSRFHRSLKARAEEMGAGPTFSMFGGQTERRTEGNEQCDCNNNDDRCGCSSKAREHSPAFMVKENTIALIPSKPVRRPALMPSCPLRPVNAKTTSIYANGHEPPHRLQQAKLFPHRSGHLVE